MSILILFLSLVENKNTSKMMDAMMETWVIITSNEQTQRQVREELLI